MTLTLNPTLADFESLLCRTAPSRARSASHRLTAIMSAVLACGATSDVDDERNTDHAWMETILRSFHCPTELAGILDFKRDYGDNENMTLNWELQRHYDKLRRERLADAKPALVRGESMEAPSSTFEQLKLEHVRWLDLSRIDEIGGEGEGEPKPSRSKRPNPSPEPVSDERPSAPEPTPWDVLRQWLWTLTPFLSPSPSLRRVVTVSPT